MEQLANHTSSGFSSPNFSSGVSWLGMAKSWAAIFLSILGTLTVLIMVIAAIRITVWRVRNDGSPMLRGIPTSAQPLPTAEPVPGPRVDLPAVTASPMPGLGTVPTPAAATSGILPFKLIIPVQGIQREGLRDTFAEARSEGRVHNAIDIMAPQRTPVLAATDGTILRLMQSDKGGMTIYQASPDQRYVLYYAHLDGYAEGLSEGKQIRQGETIAYVGDTGNATPGSYHLHFAIWLVTDPKSYWSGENINPYSLF